MSESQKSFSARQISVLGAAIAAAWACISVLPGMAAEKVSMLRILSIAPLEPSANAYGTQLLMPVWVYLLPMGEQISVWLIGTMALWGGALIVGMWSLREGAGLGAALLVSLLYMVCPVVQGELNILWSTLYLMGFWTLLAGYAGRWHSDLLGTIAMTCAVATQPLLWPVVLAVWLSFRMPLFAKDQWPEIALALFSPFFVWLFVGLVWLPSTFTAGTLNRELLWASPDPFQLKALGRSGRFSWEHAKTVFVQARIIGNLFVPFLPLAVLGAWYCKSLRWSFLALIAVCLAMLCSEHSEKAALLSAPIILPAAAIGLTAVTRNGLWLETVCVITLLVLFIVWPKSFVFMLIVACFVVVAFFISQNRTPAAHSETQ